MITVREAIPSDGQSIVAFQLEMALETENFHLDKCTVERGVNAVFKDSEKGTYYVAEIEEEIIGSLLTTFEWSDWRNGRVLWIQSVFVKKNHRGKGVYRLLYQHIKSIVESNESDFRGIRLYVDKSNAKAQKVYQKLGMQNHHYELFEWMNTK